MQEGSPLSLDGTGVYIDVWVSYVPPSSIRLCIVERETELFCSSPLSHSCGFFDDVSTDVGFMIDVDSKSEFNSL